MSNPTLPLWTDEAPPRLVAARDPRSGALRFPAYPPTSPLAEGQQPVAIANDGRVHSFTVIHPGPKTGAEPFALAYVDLPGPVRIFGRLQGDTIAIGARCHAVPDADYGYRFETHA